MAYVNNLYNQNTGGKYMYQEIEKLTNAKETIEKLAGGINPLSGEAIEKGNLICDENINDTLLYTAQKLDKLIKWELNKGLKETLKFVISKEELEKIKLPDKKIGVNEFAKHINQVINTNISKKLSGVEINKRLKQMGVLGEEQEDNKKRTVTNENSSKYGIEVEKRTFNGKEYEAIVFNEEGKKFLLDNLESIMETSA